MQSAAERTANAPARPVEGAVVLVNCFEVPAGREDEFFHHWGTLAAWFRTQPGYVSNRLPAATTERISLPDATSS